MWINVVDLPRTGKGVRRGSRRAARPTPSPDTYEVDVRRRRRRQRRRFLRFLKRAQPLRLVRLEEPELLPARAGETAANRPERAMCLSSLRTVVILGERTDPLGHPIRSRPLLDTDDSARPP